MSRKMGGPALHTQTIPSQRTRHRTGERRLSGKPLWRLSLTIAPESEEAVTESLGRAVGGQVSSYTDAESGLTTVTSFLGSETDFSDSLRKELRAELRHIAACGLSIGPGRIAFQIIRERDWAQSWKHHFQPFQVGSALLIRPSWKRLRAKPNQRVVVLDPGLSFGTGHHPTTRFCLEQLAKHAAAHQGRSLLDLGTGSGILAIAAAKLGYAPVLALDFDPDSLAVAQANARRNRVQHKIEFKRRSITRLALKTSRRASVICANLLTPLLLSERARILAQLEPNGLLVLAGILRTEFASVRAAYEAAGLRPVARRTENEWRCATFSAARPSRNQVKVQSRGPPRRGS